MMHGGSRPFLCFTVRIFPEERAGDDFSGKRSNVTVQRTHLSLPLNCCSQIKNFFIIYLKIIQTFPGTLCYTLTIVNARELKPYPFEILIPKFLKTRKDTLRPHHGAGFFLAGGSFGHDSVCAATSCPFSFENCVCELV